LKKLAVLPQIMPVALFCTPWLNDQFVGHVTSTNHCSVNSSYAYVGRLAFFTKQPALLASFAALFVQERSKAILLNSP
jgi:hypothetical protein